MGMHPGKRGINRQFWSHRRVLITGHTGFKGSWLSLWLHGLGAQVSGYALPPNTSPSLFEAADVGGVIHSSHSGNICDLEVLKAAIVKEAPEVVFHLAAQSLVRASYQDPVGTFATNVLGTVNVLEAIRDCPSVRCVVVVTSDKCYRNQQWPWGYRESDPLGGSDPYSSSKACAEIVAAAYRHSFFAMEGGSGKENQTAIATARAGNVIGGGDWGADRLVPDMIRAFSSKQTVQIRNPSAIRPWQHVLEPLQGYLMLAERLWAEPLLFSDGWNFGPHDTETWSVGAVVEHLVALWGPAARWRLDRNSHPSEQVLLRLDSARARQHVRWQPLLSTATALEWSVDWYRRQHLGESAKTLVEEQIRRYENLLPGDDDDFQPQACETGLAVARHR